jgi:UDP-glucose 4-epimerase
MIKKRILVTGANGFIGHHWCKKLIDAGHKVDAVDIKKNKNLIKSKNFQYYQDTIFNFTLIKKLIKKNDYVCHFAGIAEPKEYLKRPIEVIDLTITPSFEIIRLCNKFNKKLIFTSTSEIYGKSHKVPFSENDDRVLGSTEKTRWCYSTAKSVVEHKILAHHNQSNLNFVIFRLFNVYGPGIYGRVVDNFIDRSLKNKDILINGNGNQTRCFLYISDCIDAFYSIVFNRKCDNQIFNIGSNKEIKIIQFAKLVKKLTRSKSKILINSNQLTKFGGYEDIIRRVPDIDKLKKKLLWKPKINIEEGLKILINNFKLKKN